METAMNYLPYFLSFSCKIFAEVVVHWIFAVFLNGLNGKNSSRSIARNIFWVYFIYSRFQALLSHTHCYLGDPDCKTKVTC